MIAFLYSPNKHICENNNLTSLNWFNPKSICISNFQDTRKKKIKTNAKEAITRMFFPNYRLRYDKRK